MARQIETLVVAFFALFIFIAGGIGCLIFSIYLLFTPLYFVPILYFGWYIYDKDACNRGGRLISSVRKWTLWKYYRDCFPLELVKTADLDPQKNYIIGFHPHGFLCAGAFGNFCTDATGFSEKFPGIVSRFLTLEGMFRFPFHREIVLSLTGMCAASKRGIEWLLTKEGTGNAIVIAVGGQAEVLDSHPNSKTIRLTLRKRKGFIRLALKYGASLVPSFTFGENDLYWQWPNPDGSWLRNFQQMLLKKFGFSVGIFKGCSIFLPYRKPLTTVVGKPIDVVAMPEPTEEDITKLHEKYIQGLEDLFNKYKDKYGTSNMELDIDYKLSSN